MPSALFVSLESVRTDPALQKRGDRKIMVTELYPAGERLATEVHWQPVAAPGKCPVQLMADTEVAVFNETAKQSRHCHRSSTQLYSVLEGSMLIEVEGAEYHLAPGDLLVVNPGACHEVRRQGRFLSRVVTVNCGGNADKFEP